MVRLAERLRKQGFEKTLIKYVAPQVWAMRPSRAKRVARLFDGLLTLHPFEPDYFTPLGLQTRYVGNAVFDMDYKAGDPSAIRQQYDLSDRPILSVFFGSRASEITRLAKPFADTVIQLACAGVPTVVAYRLSSISYALVRRMIKLDYISMVNIAADAPLMPEFVQDAVILRPALRQRRPYWICCLSRAKLSLAFVHRNKITNFSPGI